MGRTVSMGALNVILKIGVCLQNQSISVATYPRLLNMTQSKAKPQAHPPMFFMQIIYCVQFAYLPILMKT